MYDSSDLKIRLYQIQKIFDPRDFFSIKSNNAYIQSYYRASKIGYSLFYISSDRMYMGISRDGIYKEGDLLEGARVVDKYIKMLRATNILEIATGRGATSAYLAAKHPGIRFDGIDLSPSQLALAQKKAKSLPNYTPVAGDYHNLSRYKTNSMNIVFVIEALCYSTDKALVMREVKRVLKKGGVFIILDGYSVKARSKMTKDELLGCKLTERGMAVNVFEDYESVIRKAKKLGYSVESSENVSKFIIPTLKRFEKLAQKYFNHPRTARIVNKLLPRKFTNNTVAGLLMPSMVSQGLLGYYITVLKKDGSGLSS